MRVTRNTNARRQRRYVSSLAKPVPAIQVQAAVEEALTAGVPHTNTVHLALERRRVDRMSHELRRVLMARSAARIEELAEGEEFAGAVKALAAGELDPYQAADRLMGP